jgi:hypothetical protein
MPMSWPASGPMGVGQRATYRGIYCHTFQVGRSKPHNQCRPWQCCWTATHTGGYCEVCHHTAWSLQRTCNP